eukprot:jgi/Botrbrau1/15010/Bobra.0018s0108.1
MRKTVFPGNTLPSRCEKSSLRKALRLRTALGPLETGCGCARSAIAHRAVRDRDGKVAPRHSAPCVNVAPESAGRVRKETTRGPRQGQCFDAGASATPVAENCHLQQTHAGGFFAIYQNKVRLGKFHFLTLHGKFGLLVTLLSFGAASGGTLAFRKLGLLQKLPSKLQPIIKAGHRSAGFVTFLLALVTIELALTHPSVWKGYGSVFWQLAVGLLGILALCFPFRFPPAPYELPSQHPPRTGFAARDDEEGHSLVLTQQDAVRAGRGAAPSD